MVLGSFIVFYIGQSCDTIVLCICMFVCMFYVLLAMG